MPKENTNHYWRVTVSHEVDHEPTSDKFAFFTTEPDLHQRTALRGLVRVHNLREARLVKVEKVSADIYETLRQEAQHD